MANQDLAFASANQPRDYVIKDQAHTFAFKAYSAGTQVVPSSATITIKAPGGAALPTPVVDATVTIAGGGDMTYALTSENAATYGANYTAVVSYVVSGVTYKGRCVFDVVLVPPSHNVVQADLAKHHVDVTDLLASGETSTQAYITTAAVNVWSHLEGRGIRPYLVLNPSEFRRAIEHGALALFFKAKKKNEEDRWAGLMREHEAEYHKELQALGAHMIADFDQSGTADGTSVEAKTGEEGSQSTGTRWTV